MESNLFIFPKDYYLNMERIGELRRAAHSGVKSVRINLFSLTSENLNIHVNWHFMYV